MISKVQLCIKRIFDILLSLVLFPILIIPLILLVLMSMLDTRSKGLFKQIRVGQRARLFSIYKIRTMKGNDHEFGAFDENTTRFGRFLRQSKLDELPQLINVILGHMSFVGPRPDIIGFADELKEDDRVILMVKPGITGPATLKYKNEDVILAMQDNPEQYNRTIIWPDKVEINKNYVANWRFYLDLKYIVQSIIN